MQEGIQTFLGLRRGDVLRHVAERRLLYVPESHRRMGEGRPQQEFDWKQADIVEQATGTKLTKRLSKKTQFAAG